MTRRRSILIAAAIVATGLGAALRVRLCCATNATTKLRSRTARLAAWTKSASLLDKCRNLRRGGFSTSRRSDISHVPPPPLSPAQLERARAAMEELYGDCCLLGRKL